MFDDEEIAGWRVVVTQPEEDRPGWVHSVGLRQSYHHPEVAIFGLPPSRFGLVNVVAELVREGRRLTSGSALEEVLIGYRMQVREIHPAWAGLFGTAEVLQLVWPDQDGVFPWQIGFDECFRESQPHLWLAVDDHPPGSWVRVLRQQASQRQR